MAGIKEIAEALVELTVKEVNELGAVLNGIESSTNMAIERERKLQSKASFQQFQKNTKKGNFKNNYKANINTRKNFKNHKI